LGDTKVRRLTRRGYPGTTIAKTLTRLGADLVAVGTHGLGGLRYVLLGSVAEHVLREARCDVLAVRPKEFEFALP
jgi:nucleotide-binding universal stress UspA family protein